MSFVNSKHVKWMDKKERLKGIQTLLAFLGYNQAPCSIQLNFVTPLENDTQ